MHLDRDFSNPVCQTNFTRVDHRSFLRTQTH